MHNVIMPSVAVDGGKKVDCDALERKAYDSHVVCYNDCGFCNAVMERANMVQYWETIDVFDLEFGPVIKIALTCFAHFVKQKGKMVEKILDQLTTCWDRASRSRKLEGRVMCIREMFLS
ncbi:hypothetical protein Ddc_18708 [Ditylenchus destructor]|nr:hypothetical protein Ddc_18708 [Ditylenchus destructor]